MRRKCSPAAHGTPLTMRVPFRLLFVGWWMAGQSWTVTGQQYYRKPSVSVSPEVVTLGGNVTIHCSDAGHPDAEFSLHKKHAYLTRLLPHMAKGYDTEFIISNTSISDAGTYWCRYCFKSNSQERCSYYSDEVHINIIDPSIPKPSIKVKPEHQNALHSSVTIECKAQGDGLYFFLRNANTGKISIEAVPPAGTANFHFPQVRSEDAGSYICQYHRRSTPFVWSLPSDSVEFIVKDPSLSKPSIKVRPEGQHEVGMEVTIECKGQENGLTFSLHKSNNLSALQTTKAEGNMANFSLSPLRPEDEGNYTCQYYHRGNLFVYSEPSDPVQVVVTDLFPKKLMTIIWASVVAGLLLVLLLLVLILVLCKKRTKRKSSMAEI
ncbi:PREDICTED: T-cell-interacting, activating receptor on myeloid cells protein 1-like [Gekko japonicus]|uniref:T-cell-interacting, activating receptor on myeloid cells protein 1-like n=1 Tax=Gekko japonicus TaxID=146911 RepID=UPI00074FFD5A|nr:PREDICTED: T-cell-interacting, activating receptor on myeloid cells protein 1-like [Gekko japonicus]